MPEFDPTGAPPPYTPAHPVAVFRYDEDNEDPEGRPTPWTYLPYVVCTGVTHHWGARPAEATLRYVFDQRAPLDFARRFDQVVTMDRSSSTFALRSEQRIVVLAFDYAGSPRILFDGIVCDADGRLDERGEVGSLTALSVLHYEYDTPLGGAIYRQALAPEVPEDDPTDLPMRFNPAGRGNRAPRSDGARSGEEGYTYPVFIDPLIGLTPSRDKVDCNPWTLRDAAKHIMYVGNPEQTWITLPDEDAVDAILPDAVLTDVTVTGKPWPVALEQVLRDHGYQFCVDFELEETPGTDEVAWTPIARLRLFAAFRRRPSWTKFFRLQTPGQPLNLLDSNVNAVEFSKKTSGVVNAYSVLTVPKQVEATFVLAPGFQIDPGDSEWATYQKWVGSGSTLVDRTKYRVWVFDETGEGHWSVADKSWAEGEPPDLAYLLGTFDAEDPESMKGFAMRRRPGRDAIFSLDEGGYTRTKSLEVSVDYAGPAPAVWGDAGASGGTWVPVHLGEWVLLDDRLGIRITSHDPNSVVAGKPEGGNLDPVNMAAPGGKITIIDNMTEAYDKKPLHFRLTTAIDTDRRLRRADVGRRPNTPIERTVRRWMDSFDKHQVHAVHRSSIFFDAAKLANPGDDEYAVRDDTDQAREDADSRRSATETARFSGPVRVPRLTVSYRIGDQIEAISGRELSLATTTKAPDGEGIAYPRVASITWNMDGQQSTTVSLSDEFFHIARPRIKR